VSRLPEGAVVRLDRDARVADDGRTVLGGTPFRALFLAPAAAGLLRDRTLRVSDPTTAALADRLVDAGIAHPVAAELPKVDESLVSYVVPVHDRAPQLDRLLASIGPGRPVVVVDDASRDPDAVARVARAHGAHLVVLTRNVGPASARNTGLRHVRTPYVAFVDSDVVVTPGAIPLLARHLVDERVAAVAPHVRGLPEARRRTWVRRYEDAASSLDLGAAPAAVRPRSRVAWVSSSCLVARVAALGEGFTPGLHVGEDVDLVWRLVEEGWSVRYEPAAVVHHEHRNAFVAWARRKVFYGTGADTLARRHPGDVAPAVLSPWSAALLVALLAQRRWSLPVAGALVGLAAARIAGRLDRSGERVRLGVRLAAGGAVNAVFQGTGLLLRHWWPAVAVGCLVSRRLRRAVVVAALTEAATAYPDHVRTPGHLDPLRFLVLRRLDDLAYGAGVWWSVLRGRSWRALLPSVGRRTAR
jgi:mycofactocin system glycosyltransferase